MHCLARLGSLMALTGVAFSTGACAAMGVRTEGTSGPIAWRVTDVAVVTREIQGRSVDGQAFTLVLTNTGDRTVTFTKMEERQYRPGTGSGLSSYPGRWILRPGKEWKLNRFASLVCLSYAGCTDAGSTQFLYRIVFTGTDDQDQPIETRLDITLPPAAMSRTPPR
jgi:hypothetical protein